MLAGTATAAPVIGTFVTYTSVSADSQLNSNYIPGNLFNQNPVVNQEMSLAGSDSGTAWAVNLPESAGPFYLEFQLDQSYKIESIYYAQRDFNNLHNGNDKVGFMEIWAGQSAFTAANPGFGPDSSVAITNQTDDTFQEYTLPNAITGQYFLIRISNPAYVASPAGKGLMGGTELRLGGVVPEPASASLLVAFGACVALRRRRAR